MSSTSTPPSVKHYRWAILTVMSVTLGVQSGVRVAFSVFYVALRQEFGWSAASTAGVFSLYMGVLAVSSPVVGWLLDRYGARRLLTLAALLVGVSLWSCSAIHTLWHFYLAYGLLLALGQTGLSSGATSVVLARWFPDMRGRAIALADIGTALGTAIYSPWSQWLIETYGWRSAFMWLGSSVIVLLVPLNCWQRSAPLYPAPPLLAMPAQPRQRPWRTTRYPGRWRKHYVLCHSGCSLVRCSSRALASRWSMCTW